MRLGIRTKISFLIMLAVALVLVFGLSLGYFWGFTLLRDAIAEQRYGVAHLLAAAVSNMINSEVEERSSDSSRLLCHLLWKRRIQESNLKYVSMDAPSMNRYFSEMDRRWSREEVGGPLFQEYLDNETSASLKDLLKGQKQIAEIFITDRFGGLVASSGKTSDFYQADEAWWQEAFNAGKGKVYVGDVEYDGSSGKWSITIALPIRGDAGEVIGICKSVTDINFFFQPLENFKMGKSGHAVLMDERGNILFHPGVVSMSMRFENFETLADAAKRHKDAFVSFSRFHKKKLLISLPLIIENRYLQAQGVVWRMVVEQDYDEVFEPLKKLIWQSGMLSAVLILIIPPVGFIFGSVFVKPLKKLHEATRKISDGDFDYKVDLLTGDEIEDLAVSFNQMTEELRRTMVCRDTLATEIEERKKMEEQQKLLMKDLEETNRIMIGREMRMIELKKEVNDLSKEAGRPAPYDILL